MKIYIVTLENGFFGSAGKSWLSLDAELFLRMFIENGFSAEIATFGGLLNRCLKRDDVVIYTSSEILEVREYIKDVAFMLDSKCNIIPSLHNLMAHENKGFQQLIRSNWDDDLLKGRYVYDTDQLTRLDFPYVLKDVSGAGGAKVRLISSAWQIKLRLLWNKVARWRRAGRHFVRKITLSKKQYEIYSYRYKVFRRLVEQEFIPGATFDYKVLVFWDKYFVAKREVRKGDFRASGSGKLSFPESCDVHLLDFCKLIFERLNTPVASLDVLVSRGKCYLVEYQTTNFGPTVLRDSNGYYTHDSNDSWGFTIEKSYLSPEFGSSLVNFVEVNYCSQGRGDSKRDSSGNSEKI